ncbi:hypothetical protein BWQ96_06799 [Gracilariopsis chorda]|uniref:Uncharacterized protein n=1 Tax=Gracilariopsis chorda TaxID=448386 RepID=A0A2V3IN43_9FLOR|nr:hypothetical protein BWQ96_06799 [Gracilariopsis chorda]|eukprot:PXF43506.1 hypothetical protein BWQ96_06799 [Gracilariopsis chorda]
MICEAATLLMEMSVTVVDKWVVHGFVWVDVDVDDSDEVWGWCHARGVGGGDDGGEVIAALRHFNADTPRSSSDAIKGVVQPGVKQLLLRKKSLRAAEFLVLVQASGQRAAQTRLYAQRTNGALIRVYALYVQAVYKGRRPTSRVLYVQTYAAHRLCGLRLTSGLSYVLHLRDGRSLSRAGNWHLGMHVVSQCDANVDVRALNWHQRQFLAANSK